MLWTKISAPTNGQPEQLTWEISGNTNFVPIISSGTVTVSSSRDWIANIDAGGLQPNKIYYYRFKNTAGNYSVIGRTRTAPLATDTNTHVRFATVSCSSIYSGFFNAYRRIAEKTDLDFVMHLGDYIYDFVDQDEEIRVPTVYPAEPTVMQEWRDRHAYYLLDPDILQHPSHSPLRNLSFLV
jgi:alkaline phosphatase D